MDPRAIIGTAIGLVFAAIIMTTATWEIDVEETYYTQEQYTHEEELIRERQVTKWPWPWQNATQLQYTVNNTHNQKGTFVYKFHFDNGKYAKTKTVEVSLLARASEMITINSPLAGVSTFKCEVIPPANSVPQQRTVKKKVNVWQYLPHLLPLLK